MQDPIPSKNALIISEPELLNALIKALWTLKYDSVPEDVQEYVSSPMIAEIANRAYDSLIALYQEQGRIGPASRLHEGRKFENSTFQLSVLPNHVRLIQSLWDAWTGAQRCEYIRLFMAPTLVTDEQIDEIIRSLV